MVDMGDIRVGEEQGQGGLVSRLDEARRRGSKVRRE